MTLKYFFLETLSIFLGDVLAVGFVALLGYVFWYVLKYPGFTVGASWSFEGWDMKKMGRFPNEADSGPMKCTPNLSVTSYDTSVKKLIHSVWVRERADVFNPGELLGHRDLFREGVLPELRTTGGDLLTFPGPAISCNASDFHKVVNTPIFIENSDGSFFKALSVGNNPKGILKFRYQCRNAFHRVRLQLFSLKSYIRKRF